MSKPISLKGTERVLIVRTDRIGDLILTTPLFQSLKENFPDIKVDALVSKYSSTILDNNPFINEVISYDAARRFSLAEELRGRRYDLALLTYPRFHLAWLLYQAHIPKRIGTVYRWYSFLFTHKVFQHRKKVEKHELEYNLDMLAPLGIKRREILPKVYLSKTETQLVELLFREHALKPDDLKIMVHPGGGRSSLRWPEDKFAQLAVRLRDKLSAKIILTGVESERALTKKVGEALGGNAIDLTGKLSLRELCAVISRTNLMVTNSTGPMHIAATSGVKVLALFCPIKTASPIRWGPYGHGHRVLLPPVQTCHCSVANCRRGNCMNLISVGQVLAEVESMLQNKKAGVENR